MNLLLGYVAFVHFKSYSEIRKPLALAINSIRNDALGCPGPVGKLIYPKSKDGLDRGPHNDLSHRSCHENGQMSALSDLYRPLILLLWCYATTNSAYAARVDGGFGAFEALHGLVDLSILVEITLDGRNGLEKDYHFARM